VFLVLYYNRCIIGFHDILDTIFYFSAVLIENEKIQFH